MIRKPLTLILVFAALFAILTGIQVYFLKNSYSLNKKEVLAEAKDMLSQLEDDVDIFDDDLVKDDQALNRLVQVETGKMTEKQLHAEYKVISDYVEPRLTQYVDSIFESKGYSVKIKKEITSIVSQNTKREMLTSPILVYKTKGEIKNPFYLSSGRWETSKNSSKTSQDDGIETENENSYYAYTVKRFSSFEITNLNSILFRNLFVLIFTSILILTGMLFIFYKSYQNLLKQRRQINNLHDMVDNVSHELRTPVATLKVVAKTLEWKKDSEEVQVLKRQVDRLEKLFQPLTTKPETIQEAPFTLKDYQLYLQDFKFTHPKVQVEDHAFAFSTLPIGKQDMETILSNLLSNCVKYGGNKVIIRIFSDDNLLRIHVEDNGIGMDKADQPYIFEKFFRIQRNNIQQTKGMGLGLYLVHKLVEKYNGQIAVESKLSQGTTFQISIPNA